MLYYGNYMELYEIHSNPTEQGEDHMVLLWGTPYHSQAKSYGECMDLYEICSHPIAIENRAKERDIYGFDM